MQPEASGLTNIQAHLQNLIQSAQQSWTYGIFWRAFHSGQGSFLDLGDGYYHLKQDEGKETNSSSTSLISTAAREQRRRVIPELYSLISEQFGLDIEGVTLSDGEWFFVGSVAKYFANGSGLPDQAWRSSFHVWITGRENLESSYCERARQAQLFGLRTLVFIPSEIGVIELGSTALNFQSMDLLNNAMKLLNFIYSSETEIFEPVQPVDESESESSNSIQYSAMVRSNTSGSYVDEDLSLGLHLGFKAWPVKRKNESESLSSSVGNYPVTVVKEKEKPQFSGKLRVGSDNQSDSSDINAFVHILKGVGTTNLLDQQFNLDHSGSGAESYKITLVQQLTGSPSHHQELTAPRPPQNPPKPPSMRLQGIRPPPLTLINRPPIPVQQAPLPAPAQPPAMVPYNNNFVRPPHQYGQPSPAMLPQFTPGDGWANTAESPISAYMRYLQNSLIDSGPRPTQPPFQSHPHGVGPNQALQSVSYLLDSPILL